MTGGEGVPSVYRPAMVALKQYMSMKRANGKIGAVEDRVADLLVIMTQFWRSPSPQFPQG